MLSIFTLSISLLFLSTLLLYYGSLSPIHNFWFGFVTISFNQGHFGDQCIRTITRAWWGNQWILSWRQQLPFYLNVSVPNNSAVRCKVTFSLSPCMPHCYPIHSWLSESVFSCCEFTITIVVSCPKHEIQSPLPYYFEFLYSFFSFFWNIAHVRQGLPMSYLGLRTYPLLTFIIL